MKTAGILFVVLGLCIILSISKLCSPVGDAILMVVVALISLAGYAYVVRLYSIKGKPLTLRDLKTGVWYHICDKMAYVGEPNLGFRNLFVLFDGSILALRNDLLRNDLSGFIIDECKYQEESKIWIAYVTFSHPDGSLTHSCTFIV